MLPVCLHVSTRNGYRIKEVSPSYLSAFMFRSETWNETIPKSKRHGCAPRAPRGINLRTGEQSGGPRNSVEDSSEGRARSRSTPAVELRGRLVLRSRENRQVDFAWCFPVGSVDAAGVYVEYQLIHEG